MKKRSAIMIAILLFAFILYGTAKFYSPSLVFFIVEQTLIQKAPPGTDPVELSNRLQILVSSAQNPGAGMDELFQISSYLEKVQQLTPEQLKEILGMHGLTSQLSCEGCNGECFSSFYSGRGNFLLFQGV